MSKAEESSNNVKKSSIIRSNRYAGTPNKMDQAAVESTWIDLSKSFDQIFQKNASHLYYEQLYRFAYNLVLAKQGEFLYCKVADKISSFVNELLLKLRELPNENLLFELSEAWENYKVLMNVVKDILMYLDKAHVSNHRKLPVYSLSLKIFRDIIIYDSKIRERLRYILLENVQIERIGGIIDRDVMRNILAMYVDVCVDTIVNNSSCNIRVGNVYEEEFEQYFLVATKEFYMNESQQFLSQNTVSDYLRKVEERINEENFRVQQYLSKTTERPLKAVLDAELISAHANILLDIQNSNLSIANNSNSAFVTLLKDNKIEDLKRLYTLLSRVPSTLDILRDCLGEYTKQCGMQIIQTPFNIRNELDSSASSSVITSSNTTAMSIQFVKEILELRDKMDLIILQAFNGDKRAYKKLQDSFDNFINITNNTPQNNSRFNAASYLATYLDEILKNGLKDSIDVDMELHIAKVLLIFRHISEKDLFENYYKQHLCKRLLNSKTNNDETEKLVLSKLKAECGYQYTSKLEGMFNDITLSKALLDQYRLVYNNNNSSSNNDEIDMDVQVLTAGYWPLQATPNIRLPLPITLAIEKFNSFYLSRNSGKKLTWMLHLGSVDIKANFPLGKRELNVSTYQACILYCFNSTESLSLIQLRELCDLPEIEFRRHLLSLCTSKLRILKKSSSTKGIMDDDVFTFNEEFSSKFKRIKVPLVSVKEITSDISDTRLSIGLPTAVEEDRRNLIDASIVRIMKTRRRFSHNDLLTEVIRQLSHRFIPSPAAIKSRIESLIERDYLERDKDDVKVYCYLA